MFIPRTGAETLPRGVLDHNLGYSDDEQTPQRSTSVFQWQCDMDLGILRLVRMIA